MSTVARFKAVALVSWPVEVVLPCQVFGVVLLFAFVVAV
jgi:hypothetical protein